MTPGVLVEIYGGAIQYVATEGNVVVYIVDHDNIRAGDKPRNSRYPYPTQVVKNIGKEIDKALRQYEKRRRYG